MIVLPAAAVILAGMAQGGGGAWAHIRDVMLMKYLGNTVFVLVLTAAFALAFAVPAAWLVSVYEFPGRRLFEWLLILPLAMPAYVSAIAFSDLLGVAGPVQTSLRSLTGLSATQLWFPDISSRIGLGFVLASALFPYVYLTARAAFSAQSGPVLDAARSLGAKGLDLFWRAGLAPARAAIAAGLALTLMEAAADYGASEYFGILTLTTGIVRAWESFGEPATAARLSILLIALVIGLVVLERQSRKAPGQFQKIIRTRRHRLALRDGAFAALFCGALFVIAFVLPISRLIWRALNAGDVIAPLAEAARNSIILASIGALFALICALMITLARRRVPRLGETARSVATLSYAIPGAVLALGAIAIFGASGLLLAGPAAVLALAWVYACRFTASGTEPLIAALDRAPKSVSEAAASLGASPWRRAREIDVPLAFPGLIAGALILFVEAMKELPATQMLRPFGWDTLAVRAFAYASDERLGAAAAPCLLITACGLIPVYMLSRRLTEAVR